MMYAFLVIAVIASVWLATSPDSRLTKNIAAALIVIFSLPNLDAAYWTAKVDTPEFFSSGLYRRYIAPGANVLVTPYFILGNSMLWQAQTEMYFRMAGGWMDHYPKNINVGQ